MSLEVHGNRRYDEGQGLVESGLGSVPSTSNAAKKKENDDSDEGLLPVLLEHYLERAGVM